MEIRQLAHLMEVATEMNFSRTAQQIHVVQSALSVAVSKLEKELGVELSADPITFWPNTINSPSANSPTTQASTRIARSTAHNASASPGRFRASYISYGE